MFLCQVPYDVLNDFSGKNINYHGVSNAAIEPLQSNLTYWDCIYSLMVSSACDSANVLAYNIGGGSIESFIVMMNDMAQQIGCKNTNFTNAHGLFDENNYTTAYDMYLITKYAIDNHPLFIKICETTSYDMPPNKKYPDGYTKFTTNELIVPNSEYYYEGVSGIKTGSIDKYYYNVYGEWDYESFEYGSRSLVSMAQQNGYTYIIVSLCAPYYNDDGTLPTELLSYIDHINLYNWVYEELQYTAIIECNQQISQINVEDGLNTDTVGVTATEEYYTLLPKSLDSTSIHQIVSMADLVQAPITKGTIVGDLELIFNGETLTKIPLAIERDVDLDMNSVYMKRLHTMITAPQFYTIIVLIILLIILSLISKAIRQKNYRNKKRNKYKYPRSK